MCEIRNKKVIAIHKMNMTSLNFVAGEFCNGTAAGFADGLTVWLNKPHVVNRRLCGSKLQYFCIFSKKELTFDYLNEAVSSLGLQIERNEKVEHWLISSETEILTDNKTTSKNLPKDLESGFDAKAKNLKTGWVNTAKNTPEVSGMVDGLAKLKAGDIAVIIRQMLPKQPERHVNLPELVLFDKSKEMCTFVALQSADDSEIPTNEIIYRFKFESSPNPRISLYTSTTDCSEDSSRKLSLTWIQSHLLQKLARWSEQPSLRTNNTSLSLVSIQDYSRLYSELKNKYGIPLAKNWPEKTSAQKYVFEDVAIATYLLLLWEDERKKNHLKKKQSFVDLGCGNGLLVHILASEGHPGYGIDVRKRSIWDSYGPETVLKEMPIKPSSDCLFPDCDWLIGNHSDELTPWIPVIAARSSYTCRYFLLPCCFWDFNCKYSSTQKSCRQSDGLGKYGVYLDFVRTVGEKCGFVVEEDKLRIPSTKSICFVGRSRTYDQTKEKDMDQMRQSFIIERCNVCADSSTLGTFQTLHLEGGKNSENCDSCEDWVVEFKPRSQVEVTRNCVTVRQEVKDHVIQTVFSCLLKSEECEIKETSDGKSWNRGGKISVGDVVAMFDKDLLKELKSECGGLQTLLRNCCHIFQVSGGQVQLRDFTLDDPFEGRRRKTEDSDRSMYLKTTLCWFHGHHPQGCPKNSDDCLYAHGLTELRPKPVKVKR